MKYVWSKFHAFVQLLNNSVSFMFLSITLSCLHDTWRKPSRISLRHLIDVRHCNGGASIQPRYTIINAVLLSFNKCTVLSYLKVTVDALEGCLTCSNLLSRSYVCLCIAHMIKAMLSKLHRLIPQSQNRIKRQSFDVIRHVGVDNVDYTSCGLVQEHLHCTVLKAPDACSCAQ